MVAKVLMGTNGTNGANGTRGPNGSIRLYSITINQFSS